MMLDDYQEIKPGTTIQNYYVLNKIGTTPSIKATADMESSIIVSTKPTTSPSPSNSRNSTSNSRESQPSL